MFEFQLVGVKTTVETESKLARHLLYRLRLSGFLSTEPGVTTTLSGAKVRVLTDGLGREGQIVIYYTSNILKVATS